MRVTNNMVTSQVIFNTQLAIKRYMNVQEGLSSGRRINRPSDDPLGTLRDLDYRTELSKITQYRKNISQGLTWLTTYDSALADVKNLVSEAKEVAITMANDTYDAAARQASANEVKSILDQIIQIANTQLEGRHIFSGFRTSVKPFILSGNGAEYMGDDGNIQFEIETSVRQTINLTGSDVFLRPYAVIGEEADLDVGVTAATLLSDLNNADGVDLAAGTFTITDSNLNVVTTVDISAAVTVGDAITAINAQLTADGQNMQVSLGIEGNNLRVEMLPSSEIALVTNISKLNNGQGIDMLPGHIRITDGAGVDFIIDLSDATTIGEIIIEFNTQVAGAGIANVTMGLNGTSTGLAISDTNGVPLGLRIEDMSTNEQTAAGLGIEGSIAPTLVGTDLTPQPSFQIDEIAGTTAGDIGLFGSYYSDKPGANLDPALTLTSQMSDLRHGLGIDDSEFIIWQGEDSLTVDLSDPTISTVAELIDKINNSSLTVTASINSSGRGIQIVNDDPNKSLAIHEVGNQKTARQMDLFGSSDMIGTLLTLIKSLEDDDMQGISLLLDELDGAIIHGLDQRAIVGATARRLEVTDFRLVDLNLSYTGLLSEVEDADLTKMVTDLSTYENNYRAALLASSRIIQNSLLDFLR